MRPLIWSDFPDPDVIRVGDEYYMITTTMHIFPGGDILSSRDLINWRMRGHVFTKPEGTDSQKLKNGGIYGKGMWAATLRYHEGVFHVLFVCNDTHKTYHFTSASAEGPWEHHPVDGFYHDCSLLFDNEHVYLAWGNREIHITEMKPDLSAPLPGGLDIIAVRDKDSKAYPLGFEGTHFYKVSGKYYLFFIHWPSFGHARRTEAVYMADRIEGPYTGFDILDEDMGFYNQGIAQGGIVDTPDGKWYMMLFQDRFACGRVPVLCAFEWENAFPSRVTPLEYECDTRLLFQDDPLRGGIGPMWQWNHLPEPEHITVNSTGLALTALFASDAEHARNTLTARTFGPLCACEVSVDCEGLSEGDEAGITALQGCFASLSMIRENGGYYLILRTREGEPGNRVSTEAIGERYRVPVHRSLIRLGAVFDFSSPDSFVRFYYREGVSAIPIRFIHPLYYRLDHFMGCRIALHCFSRTDPIGGTAVFSDFAWTDPETIPDVD